MLSKITEKIIRENAFEQMGMVTISRGKTITVASVMWNPLLAGLF